MLSSIRQHVATLQFDSCAEKHSLCGTVMIHDGLNLTCLDQGHGVRSRQLCRERQPLWNSHDGLNLRCLINAVVFVPTAQDPPKAGAKELLYEFDR